ncbi:MAG TPA: hypothetical protein DEF47_24950 [Herpetosiphon sp.]|uniref:DUF4878 domain-containing protein n=2 Tax=Herpetosiphon TaxID=64 RepID=A9B0W5_HERA2|nr:hypothetical protein [Herpetosiphon sp.]ABX03835.1 hypothetical protein Haur_1187 [Herpetosiphon aurantiacus DSM 785]HBW53145.1 hypothetical protein [Herpetosiphon sp.]
MRFKQLLIGCLLLTLTACGGDDTAPVNQVKAFVAATEERNVDRMIALMVPDMRRDAGWQLRQVMPRIQSIDYQDDQYTLEKIDDGRAYVQVNGILVAQMTDGQTVEYPANQLVELIEQDDGTWLVANSGFEIPNQP